MSAATTPKQFEFALPKSLGLAPGAEAWIPFGASRVRLVVAGNDRAPVEEKGMALAPVPESVAAGPEGDRV